MNVPFKKMLRWLRHDQRHCPAPAQLPPCLPAVHYVPSAHLSFCLRALHHVPKPHEE